jgi:hypothetical protein
MKRVLLNLAFLLSSTAVIAQPIRILFIGNSFTATEDVPGRVKAFADEIGLNVEIWSHMPGGVSVGDVSQGTMAHMNNPQVFDLIRDHQPDYVVLQDNQGRFVDKDKFPDPAASKVVEGHLKIRDSMRRHNSCARMVFFAGWGLKNCWPDVGTGQDCIENIYGNYVRLNGLANEIVAPIGLAWLRSQAQLPLVDLWSPDEAHESAEGAYLTAAVIFATIARTNTEPINYTGGNINDTAAARIMRRIAYQTVVDSVRATALANFSPTLTYNGTTLTAAAGYTNYDWYRDGTFVATGSANTHTPSTQGCYQVVVTDNNNCQQRSLDNCLTQTNAVNTVERLKLSLSPNPVSTALTLVANANGSYNITNLTGAIVAKGIVSNGKTGIQVAELPAGMYICSVLVNGEAHHLKFVKD